MNSFDLENLEKSVTRTGTQLEFFASKLVEVEKNLETGDKDVDDLAITAILDSVTEVKNEYQNLQKDIREVQQLQKEMTKSMRMQIKVMTQTCNLLKKRIESTSPPPH